jgi:subtilisin family serine protease
METYMKRKFIGLSLSIVLAAQTVTLTSTTPALAATADKSKSYIIGLKDDVVASEFADKKGLGKTKRFKNTHLLAAKLDEQQLNEIKQSTEVSYVERDTELHTASLGSIQSEHANVKKMKKDDQTVPWGIHDIGADLSAQNKNTGKGVKVAVIDTGITKHSDLKIRGGISFVEGVTDFTDDNGHGTHVAGTIAAENNKLGVLGVAPDAELYAVKALDKDGNGSYSQVIEGIDWAIDNKMDIISMSFGAKMDSPALHDAVKRASDSGILVVAAAGNEGSGYTADMEPVEGKEKELFPARYPEVLSVGAVNNSYKRAGFSSTGANLALVAPGTQILSTTNDGKYGVMNGTSMAAPHVTGAAAALWSSNKKLKSDEVKNILLDSATPLGNQSEYGHGFVNLAKALGITDSSIIDPSAPTDVPPVVVNPEPGSPEQFDISKYDSRILTLSKHLLNVKERALSGEQMELAKKIEDTYNQLNILNTSLHKLPDELSSNKAEDQVLSVQRTIHQFYTDNQEAFLKLEKQYNTVIEEYSIQTLSAKNQTLSTQSDFSIQSYNKTGDGQTVTAGSTATVSLMLSEPKPSGVRVTVYAANNPSATVASSTIANAPANTAISYNWNVPSSQTPQAYTIQFSYPDNVGTSYNDYFTVYVSAPPSPGGGGTAYPDTFEPNNSTSQPTNALPGNTYTSYLSYSSDVDFYRFTANATGGLTINMTVPSDQDYDVSLLNSTGSTTLASGSAGTGQPETFTYYVTGGNVYYLKVYGFNGSYSASPYSLSIRSIQGSIPAAPTNLTATATDTTATLSWAAVSGATKYHLLKNGVEVATTTTTSYTYTGLTASTSYSLSVAAENASGVGTYSGMTIATQAPAVPTLSLNTPIDVDLPTGMNRVYKFTPSATGSYKIFTGPYAGTGSNNDTVLEIYSDANLANVITTNDDSNGTNFSEITPQLTGGTTYYVKLRPFSSGIAVHARLTAQTYTPPPQTILVNSPQDLDVPAGGSKVFKFVPTVNGTYKINTDYFGGTSASGMNDTMLYLYSDANLTSLLASNDDIPGSRFSEINQSLSAGVSYYIKVAGYNSGAVHARFQVQMISAQITPLSNNVPVDFSVVQNGNIRYSFTPSQSGTYSFTTSSYQNNQSLADTVLMLYSDSNYSVLLDQNDDISPSTTFSSLQRDLQAGNTYYVKVTGYSGSAVNARLTATYLYSKINLKTTVQGTINDLGMEMARVYPNGKKYIKNLQTAQNGTQNVDYFIENGMAWYDVDRLALSMPISSTSSQVNVTIDNPNVLAVKPIGEYNGTTGLTAASSEADVEYSISHPEYNFTVFMVGGINTTYQRFDTGRDQIISKFANEGYSAKVVYLYPYGVTDSLTGWYESWTNILRQMYDVKHDNDSSYTQAYGSNDYIYNCAKSWGGSSTADSTNLKIFIGHSGGGVASYRLAQRFSNEGIAIRRVIQLGAPKFPLSYFTPDISNITIHVTGIGPMGKHDPIPDIEYIDWIGSRPSIVTHVQLGPSENFHAALDMDYHTEYLQDDGKFSDADEYTSNVEKVVNRIWNWVNPY